jgi:hypothetical protein
MISGWLFLSPNLLGFLIFFAGPLLLSFYFSFTDSDAFNTPKWIGFENYAKILNITLSRLVISPNPPAMHWTSASMTKLDASRLATAGFFRRRRQILLAGAAQHPDLCAVRRTPERYPGPFPFEPAQQQTAGHEVFPRRVFHAQHRRHRRHFAGLAVAVQRHHRVHQLLHHGDCRSFWNQALPWVDRPQIQWTSNERDCPASIIIMAAWQTMGFNTVLFLAGLQNIPGELYEAATVDGAGAWAKFWNA